MGWGQEPHEGWADAKRPDGTWHGPTTRSGDPDPVALRAACGCGWHSEREHPVPPRPRDILRGEDGIPYGDAWESWSRALGAADEACWEDWRAEHYNPLLGYEPHTQLILGRTDGGLRHFLNGAPVHAGDSLELQLADGQWLPVRYEWSFNEKAQPTAYAAIGLPEPARGIADAPLIEFALPSDAILRWPERESERTSGRGE